MALSDRSSRRSWREFCSSFSCTGGGECWLKELGWFSAHEVADLSSDAVASFPSLSTYRFDRGRHAPLSAFALAPPTTLNDLEP